MQCFLLSINVRDIVCIFKYQPHSDLLTCRVLGDYDTSLFDQANLDSETLPWLILDQ